METPGKGDCTRQARHSQYERYKTRGDGLIQAERFSLRIVGLVDHVKFPCAWFATNSKHGFRDFFDSVLSHCGIFERQQSSVHFHWPKLKDDSVGHFKPGFRCELPIGAACRRALGNEPYSL